MGIGPLSRSQYNSSISSIPKGNPVPWNFRVNKHKVVKNNLVVEICYPNCTNYEGNKILVYKNMSFARFSLESQIDPHFSNSTIGIFPIARFAPTSEGWNLAIKCAEIID